MVIKQAGLYLSQMMVTLLLLGVQGMIYLILCLDMFECLHGMAVLLHGCSVVLILTENGVMSCQESLYRFQVTATPCQSGPQAMGATQVLPKCSLGMKVLWDGSSEELILMKKQLATTQVVLYLSQMTVTFE